MGEVAPFPTATVRVFGLYSDLEATAIIDTGFEGYISLPTELAEPLGLVLKRQTLITLANGQEYRELAFSGEVEFLGQRMKVPILLMDGGEVLIGNLLLHDCQLVIDYPTKKVNLFRTERKKKK